MAQSRRTFVLTGLALLAGCASPARTDRDLPRTPWGDGPDSPLRGATTSGTTGSPRTPTDLVRPVPYRPGEREKNTGLLSGSPTGILPRSAWSTGRPVPARMNRLTRVYRITVHHAGMTFSSSVERLTASLIDRIRQFHQNQRGWGDIGYHYIIDRAGRIWEGRPTAYQGAHVKYNNVGNIGVMCLGNFDEQSPTAAQLDALNQHVLRLMSLYRVPTYRVFTHQELMPTRCPGVSLQRHMLAVRRDGRLRLS